MNLISNSICTLDTHIDTSASPTMKNMKNTENRILIYAYIFSYPNHILYFI